MFFLFRMYFWCVHSAWFSENVSAVYDTPIGTEHLSLLPWMLLPLSCLTGMSGTLLICYDWLLFFSCNSFQWLWDYMIYSVRERFAVKLWAVKRRDKRSSEISTLRHPLPNTMMLIAWPPPACAASYGFRVLSSWALYKSTHKNEATFLGDELYTYFVLLSSHSKGFLPLGIRFCKMLYNISTVKSTEKVKWICINRLEMHLRLPEPSNTMFTRMEAKEIHP